MHFAYPRDAAHLSYLRTAVLLASCLVLAPLTSFAADTADLPKPGVLTATPAAVGGTLFNESVVFPQSLPNSIERTVAIPVGGADVAIFLRDCCIRDDVVEVYVDDCFVARVDSQGGPDGTHLGETHVVSLAQGVHRIEFRNTFSRVGASGWSISATSNPFTGTRFCGIKAVDVVCRPLESPADDTCKMRSRLGRHCYFLVTDSQDNKTTYSAFDIGGLLKPQPDGDPEDPPGGCGGGVLASDCIPVLATPTQSLNDIVDDLKGETASEGKYDHISNNSNLWVERRIEELGLGIVVPPTAVSNKAEFCAQLPIIEEDLKEACGLSDFKIFFFKFFGAPRCP